MIENILDNAPTILIWIAALLFIPQLISSVLALVANSRMGVSGPEFLLSAIALVSSSLLQPAILVGLAAIAHALRTGRRV